VNTFYFYAEVLNNDYLLSVYAWPKRLVDGGGISEVRGKSFPQKVP